VDDALKRADCGPEPTARARSRDQLDDAGVSGITFATLVTLVLVPVNLMIADDIGSYYRARISGLKAAVESPQAQAPAGD